MPKTNDIKFGEMYDRLFGALPSLPHRGSRRLADDKDIDDLPARILHQEVVWYGFDGKQQPAGHRNRISLAAAIGWLDSGLSNLMKGINANGAKLDGLTVAVKALGEKQGMDPATMATLVEAAVKESLKDSLGTYELTRVAE